ncbi:PRC-barrel domain-containing protein [Leifsonia sp. NPDC058194]|uniref:PRC-barrel domain-containing protein n=1 Tax=Leifsonia sp. NPDC058194 TaxID=3346374 RepID=UPI0036D980FD
MILSDLMQAPVYDPDGSRLGRVIDARFVVDGAPGQLLAHARLDGFVVSSHSGSSFLGYERNEETSPWLIARFLRWRHRGSFLVRWDDIERVSAEAIRLRPGYRRFDPRLRESAAAK